MTTVTQSVAMSSVELDTCLADHYLHENCDEALFRPVVTVISDVRMAPSDDTVLQDAPEPVGTELIVPVMEEEALHRKSPEKEIEEKMAEIAVSKKAKKNKKHEEKEPSPPPLEPEQTSKVPKVQKKPQTGSLKSRRTKKGAQSAKNLPEDEPKISPPDEKIEDKIDEILLDEPQQPPPDDDDEDNLPQYKTLKQDFEMIQDTLLKDSIVTTTAKRDEQFPEIVNNFFDVTTTKLDLEFPEEDDCDRVVEPLAPLEPFELKFEPMFVYQEEEPMLYDSMGLRRQENEQFWSDHFYSSYEEKFSDNHHLPTERILSVSGSSENDSESSSGGEKASEGSDGHDEELQPLINASGGASEGSPQSDRYAADQKVTTAHEDKESSTKASETLPTTNQSDSKQKKKKSRKKNR